MVTKGRLARSTPDDRRDHIVVVAAQAFADEGYGATSMSTIAARLGGSKATLYKYFPSKELLFGAVMEHACQRVMAPLQLLRSSNDDNLEALLAEFGARYLDKIYQPEALDIHRLIQSEGGRFPELPNLFFRAGPDNMVDVVSETLARFVASGLIACDDLPLATGQFLGMLRGDRHFRFTSGLLPALDPAEIERHARFAARIFVRGLLRR